MTNTADTDDGLRLDEKRGRWMLLQPSAVASGQRVQLRVPAGTGKHYAVRAIDDAGNIGPVRLRATTAGRPPANAPARPAAGPVSARGALPATGPGDLAPLLAVLVLLSAGAVHRQRARRE